mmetsp:Transcript_38753/g.94842  ORF Transcript_38753/g.94842 Transcript_38753/m.94842 type:complete len:256 (+) Transcript_38753:449-1216(+)
MRARRTSLSSSSGSMTSGANGAICDSSAVTTRSCSLLIFAFCLSVRCRNSAIACRRSSTPGARCSSVLSTYASVSSTISWPITSSMTSSSVTMPTVSRIGSPGPVLSTAYTLAMCVPHWRNFCSMSSSDVLAHTSCSGRRKSCSSVRMGVQSSGSSSARSLTNSTPTRLPSAPSYTGTREKPRSSIMVSVSMLSSRSMLTANTLPIGVCTSSTFLVANVSALRSMCASPRLSMAPSSTPASCECSATSVMSSWRE